MTKEERVRNEILDSAKMLFQQYGYNKATMEDIARQAGKGKSTVYYYYTSKEDIFYAVVERDIQDLYVDINRAVSAQVPVAGKLEAFASMLLHNLRAKTILYHVVMRGMDNNILSLIARKLRENYGHYLHEITGNILNEGVARGEFRRPENVDIEAVAYLFVTTLRGLSEDLYLGTATEEYLAGMARQYINMIVATLKPDNITERK